MIKLKDVTTWDAVAVTCGDLVAKFNASNRNWHCLGRAMIKQSEHDDAPPVFLYESWQWVQCQHPTIVVWLLTDKVVSFEVVNED